MSDLDVLFPSGIPVTINGETLTVLPFTFGMLPSVTKHLVPIVNALAESGLVGYVLDETTKMKSIQISKDWAQRIPAILEAGGENVIALAALAISKPRAFLDTVQLDEGISLVKAIVDVNMDLIAKKVLPMMPVAPAPAQDGETLSDSSKVEDTATAKSPDTH